MVLHFKFNPPAFRAFTVTGDCFSQKLFIKFTSQKGKNIGTFEVLKCVPNQRRIDFPQSFTALKHHTGCVLALVYTPVIALMADFFYGIKIRVHPMCKEIKLAAEAFESNLSASSCALWMSLIWEKELSYMR